MSRTSPGWLVSDPIRCSAVLWLSPLDVVVVQARDPMTEPRCIISASSLPDDRTRGRPPAQAGALAGAHLE